jgi:hypothetical protein
MEAAATVAGPDETRIGEILDPRSGYYLLRLKT